MFGWTVFVAASVSWQKSVFVTLPSGDNESVHINSLDVNVGNLIRADVGEATMEIDKAKLFLLLVFVL